MKHAVTKGSKFCLKNQEFAASAHNPMKHAVTRGSNLSEKLDIFFAYYYRGPSGLAGIFRGVAAADAQLRVGLRRQRS